MAAKLVPEAAKRYTALLSEVRTIEHEISDPRYQNRLASCQADLTQIKEELETHRTEKESLLEKTARGRQILIGSHFTDEASIQNKLRQTQEAYKEYREKTRSDGSHSPLFSGGRHPGSGNGILHQKTRYDPGASYPVRA